MRFRRLTLVVTALFTAGCSSILGIQDGDRPEGKGEQTAEYFREQVMRNLVVSATPSVTRMNGVDHFSAKGTATNVGPDTIRASAQGTEWLIRVYASPDLSGTPIWRTEDAGYSQQAVLFPFEIAPGATVSFETLREPVDMVFDGAPAGTYYVALSLTVRRPDVTMGSWPAGEFTR